MPWPPRRGDPLPADGIPVLTDRDVELLEYMAEGRSTSQIAAAMSVTSNTARTRIRRVQGKLAVPARSQVVHTARELGII
jgi:DNA-binding CsgD family transcriptional regulator